MRDLPSEYEGEVALPDEFHALLGTLLTQTFQPPAFYPDRCFCAVDMYLYYQPLPEPHGFRPDWFGVVDVPALYEGDLRGSYATWDEGVNPLLVVEALSPGTARNDLGRGAVPRKSPTKWDVYETVLKVPYYVTIDHHKYPAQIRFFKHDGEGFEEVHPADDRLWMPEAGLGIGRWKGKFGKSTREWVRFYDVKGNWIPTPEERADRERKEKERERKAKLEARMREKQERLAKEAAIERENNERAEKERLAEMLRALGIDPDAR